MPLARQHLHAIALLCVIAVLVAAMLPGSSAMAVVVPLIVVALTQTARRQPPLARTARPVLCPAISAVSFRAPPLF